MFCGRSVVFSETPVSFTNETERHDISEILMKAALGTITLTGTLKALLSNFSIKEYEISQQY